MVTGQHIATCNCCGHQWTVGDAIPSVCESCEKKGHTGGFECPACKSIRELYYGKTLKLKLSQFVTVFVDGPYARFQGYGPDGKETTHFDITRPELVALLQLLTMMVTPDQQAAERAWLADCEGGPADSPDDVAAKLQGDNPQE